MILNMERLEKKPDEPVASSEEFENPYEQLLKMHDSQKFCVIKIGGPPKSLLELLKKE